MRNASDFVEADCLSLNATMVNDPDYIINYFITGIVNIRIYLNNFEPLEILLTFEPQELHISVFLFFILKELILVRKRNIG